MEVHESNGDFTISQNSELRNLRTMTGSSDPVRRSEDVGTMSDGEDGTMANMDDTPVHKDRERTQKDLRPARTATKR